MKLNEGVRLAVGLTGEAVIVVSGGGHVSVPIDPTLVADAPEYAVSVVLALVVPQVGRFTNSVLLIESATLAQAICGNADALRRTVDPLGAAETLCTIRWLPLRRTMAA